MPNPPQQSVAPALKLCRAARVTTSIVVLASACFLLGVAVPTPSARAGDSPKTPNPLYETRREHSRDGIGKFFMGREIAHVMGHQAAEWLERPEREEEEQPARMVDLLGLKPGDVVADIGAGTGYVSWRMAKKVGDKGQVYAVEIQPEMLEMIADKMKNRGVTNVKGVLGTIENPNLPPGSVDLLIMVDVYHEFSNPYEMMANICRALKVGGRVAFVEYRAEDPSVPIKALHKMSEAQVRKEAALHPLEWIETVKTLPRQHVIFFKKRAAKPG